MLNKIIFMTVLFLANTIQIITGFAGNMLAMPPSMILVGYESSKVVLNIFTLAACGWITYKNRKNIQWRVLFKMCFFMLLGMAWGINIIKYFNLQILSYIYGIMILCIAVKKLFIKNEINLPKGLMIIILFFAGVIHGMFVSGGALLVIYAVWALPEKDKFRATVAPVWVVLGLILMYSHYKSGLYTSENLILIFISIVPLVLSIKIGNILYDKINQQTFLKITYILLIIAAILVFI